MTQAKWARFRFSIIGPLLSSPPQPGELRKTLAVLARKQWRHPITGMPVTFGISTLERWFYQAKKSRDPVNVLRSKRRSDAAQSRQMSAALKQMTKQQYRDHPGWSYQLHTDNLHSLAKQSEMLGKVPSYSTVRRYMLANSLCKRRAVQRHTDGAKLAAQRLENREVRSFEMDHVHSLWHLDFHHGSRKILNKDGEWVKPLLLCILDDRSRLVCHMQ